MISADDWNKVQSEVSDDELEAATGGVNFKVKRRYDSRTRMEEAKKQWERDRRGHQFGD